VHYSSMREPLALRTSIEELTLIIPTSDSGTSGSQLPSGLALPKELPVLIHRFASSEMTIERSEYGRGILLPLLAFLDLDKAAKLGRQETMTATADSRFVNNGVKKAWPPLVAVSTVRKMSNMMVMKAQQKIPARPSFVAVRI